MTPAASHALRSRTRKSSRTRKKRGRWLGGLNKPVVATAILLIVLGFGYLWLRDSSLVEVRTVKIGGVTKSDPKALTGEIKRAAKDMTTLHVDNGALARIADRYPAIKEIRADSGLPNKMTLHVVHQSLIAQVTTSSGIAVITDTGEVVKGVKGMSLPRIRVQQKVSGNKIKGATSRASLALLVATPAIWRKRVKSVHVGERGLVVVMRKGPRIYFGEGTDPKRQWLAASRLLAEPSVRGATYIDVSSPERSAVGGLGDKEVQPELIQGAPAIPTDAPVPIAPPAGQDQQQQQPVAPADGQGADAAPAPEGGVGQAPQQGAQPAPEAGATPQPPVTGNTPQTQAPTGGGASAQP